MKKIIFCFFLTYSFCSLATVLDNIPATYTPGVEGKLNDNKLYAGISWEVGAKASLDAIFGFKATQTKFSGNIRGGDLNIGIPLDRDHFKDIKFKAEYINGNTTGQGEAGIGYIVGRDKFLGTIGYSLPYLKIGTDYLITDGLEPYLQINTLSKYKKPTSSLSTYSCNDSFYSYLQGSSCWNGPPPP